MRTVKAGADTVSANARAGVEKFLRAAVLAARIVFNRLTAI
jgi:hypothetical protein